ncbi:hypothetical protein BTVI_55007 [Pitangus sulphuratus]|nr:hypothetical protein BTVI_55007 [Pitangus sulphuratus]
MLKMVTGALLFHPKSQQKLTNPHPPCSQDGAESCHSTLKRAKQLNTPPPRDDVSAQHDSSPDSTPPPSPRSRNVRFARGRGRSLRVSNCANSPDVNIRQNGSPHESRTASKNPATKDTPTYSDTGGDSPTAENKWHGPRKQTKEAGDLESMKVFPVFRENNREPQWEPVPYPILRDAKKVVTDYGLNSPFVSGMLDSLFAAYTLTPTDIRVITKGLLNLMQYSLFEQEWKKLIRQYAEDSHHALHVPVQDLINELYGEGPYSSNRMQTRIPFGRLDKTKSLALEAIKAVAEATTTSPSFAHIQQGLKESFL